jgi:hypothetical protein
MILDIGTKTKLRVVLNPWARAYVGRMVMVSRVPSLQPGYDADVRASDGRLLAVNWSQLDPLTPPGIVHSQGR